MEWIQIDNESAFSKIKEESKEKPVVIFKHSTRCSISAAALARLERSWKKEEMNGTNFYFLDLLTFRPLSLKVAEEFDVEHESPQLLLISNGECVFHSSHMSISYNEVKNQLGKIA